MNKLAKTWLGIFRSTRGRFFTVHYVKDDGSIRVLNGKMPNKVDVDNTGHLIVWDLQERGYRKVNLNNIYIFNSGQIRITM